MDYSSKDRENTLQDWLDSISEYCLTELRTASEDASFRRYFRVTDSNNGNTYVVMDAPPDKEDCTPFLHIAKLLRNAGVNAPEILKQDIEQGFLLLSDLGERPYLDQLNNKNADTLYGDAITALIKMQTISESLPAYDEQHLRDEMSLFESWYINKHLEITLSSEQQNDLESIFKLLVGNALEQPRVFVHQDYHSRNLMLLEKNNPGVIDFQDAVTGPVSYDLVSLFKDCYIEWPRKKIEEWLSIYLKQSNQPFDLQQLIKWFDLMGIQRHLKVLGIFARLNYRDGKQQYLNNLPLTLKYVIDTSKFYKELAPLAQLLEQVVINHPKVTAS